MNAARTILIHQAASPSLRRLRRGGRAAGVADPAAGPGGRAGSGRAGSARPEGQALAVWRWGPPLSGAELVAAWSGVGCGLDGPAGAVPPLGQRPAREAVRAEGADCGAGARRGA